MRRSRLDTFSTSNNVVRCQAKQNHTFSTEQYIKGKHSIRFFTGQDGMESDEEDYYNSSVGVVPSTNPRVCNIEERYSRTPAVDEYHSSEYDSIDEDTSRPHRLTNNHCERYQ